MRTKRQASHEAAEAQRKSDRKYREAVRIAQEIEENRRRFAIMLRPLVYRWAWRNTVRVSLMKDPRVRE